MKPRNRYCQISLGLVYVLSSIFKAVNIQAFGEVVNSFVAFLCLNWLDGLGAEIGIGICWLEMSLGLLMLQKLYERPAAVGVTVMMSAFTYITYLNYTGLYGGIESCGCFGEIIHLTASETFYKNVVLMIMTTVLLGYHVYTHKDYHWNIFSLLKNRHLYVTLASSILLPIYSYCLMTKMEQSVYVLLYILLCFVVLVTNAYMLQKTNVQM